MGAKSRHDPKAWPLRGSHRFAAAPLPHERRSLRPKALAELAAVGWRLDEYAKGKWETGDPRHPTVTLLPLFNGTSPPIKQYPTPCLTAPGQFLKTQQRRAFAGRSQIPSKIL
ncbi:TPA: hypothetical protein L2B26_005278 [Klebsiella oxytoca]|nr:hypothetical protein [Escherichia coli]MCB7694006.1 hypothetical protein [Klebsiella pneumoniae]HBN2794314.1 hypothetical protein [Klebsiella oxytoca]HBO4457562.1 hypothetical protein [Pseudomonas aeruginosa]HEI8691512.1 hypothetical protein [Proteus mirabilis]